MSGKKAVLRISYLACLCFLLCGTCYAGAAQKKSKELGLAAAFKLAENLSPRLKAAHAQNEEAQATVGISKSFYYPTLDLGAVDSTGFPGSTGTAVGVSGLMASPFRSGAAAGIYSKLELFDRTRAYALSESKWNLQSRQEQLRVVHARVDQEVLEAYIEASRLRAHLETWEFMNQEIGHASAIVDKLVKTGQHSQVSRLLVHDQLIDAQMKESMYRTKYLGAVQRVALLTGQPANEIDCISADNLDEATLNFLKVSGPVPILAQAQADVNAAEARVAKTRAENLPKLSAIASTGYMQNARLVPKQDVSAAVGVDLPIFEGFRIHNEVRQAQARLVEKKENMNEASLEVKTLLTNYQTLVQSAKEQLTILNGEQQAARDALKMAKVRYVSYRGLLVDVREAIRNLARINMEINDTKADLILALGSSEILQGAVAFVAK